MLYLGDNPIAGLNKPLAVRNIGEIVQSTLPLTDAGLHLLDGSRLSGDGIYKEFVDYIAKLYNNTQVSGYKLNVNKVGSLTDNNGVLSGFSASNYAVLPTAFNPQGNTWEIVFKFTTGNDLTGSQYIFASQIGTTNATRYGLRIYTSNGKIAYTDATTTSAWNPSETVGSTTLSANTTYWVKATFDGTNRVVSISTDGEIYTQEISVALNTASTSFGISYIGVWNSGTINSNLFTSIDLKESYININGQRWWTGAEAIKPCFCTESQWQESVTQYGSCGKFVYDSTLNTVRLPKVSDILQGTTDLTALGNLVVSGLPQHTHTRGTMEIYGYLGDVVSSTSSGANGAFNWWNTGAVTGVDNQQQSLMASDFYASRNWTGSTSNANYTSPTDTTSKVQPQTIKTLLYIVIATSSKTDVQVDIDEIATDLNGKVDTDLSNVSNTAGFRKLVELYNNGTSFYKVYEEYNPQDGSYVGKWCEQGGQISYPSPTWYSVTFLKPFVDTNYLVYGTYITPKEKINNASLAIEKNSPSSCSITVYGIGFTAVWYACGYIR